MSTLFVSFQITLIVLVATHHIGGHPLLASTTVEFVGALVVVILLDLDYIRSIRPSFIISAYLSVSLLLEVARVRTAWLLLDSLPYSVCLSASLAVKLLLLVLQNLEKKRWFIRGEKILSDESIGGPFNRGLFIWLNSLLRKGYTALLTGNELPSIHEKLSSQDLSERFGKSWKKSNQKNKNALLFTVLKCLRWEIAGIALPRLAVMGLSVAQPFMVGKVVSILQKADSLSLNMGYGLVGATAIVFIGIAVSEIDLACLYWRYFRIARA